MNLKITDNFLTESELETIHALVNERGYTYGWKSNATKEARHWNCRFGGSVDFTADEVIPQEQIDPFLWGIWERIRGASDRKLVRLYSNAYTYGTEGAPHYDSQTDDNITHLFYINRIWKPEWAGETVFFSGDDIYASILPAPGRLVEFPGTMFHAARSVSRYFIGVRQILVYKSVP